MAFFDAIGDFLGSDIFAMSGFRNPEKALMAAGVGAGLGGGGAAPASAPMPTPAPGGIASGAGAAMGGAPAQAPMPTPTPGTMAKLGNPSWWGSLPGSEMGKGLAQSLMAGGQQMQQGQEQQPPMPPPAAPPMNPEVIRMAMQMMRDQSMRGPNGLPSSMPMISGGRRL